MADAKQGKSPIEDFYNGSQQARVVLAKPRLGGFGSSSLASSSNKACNNPFGSILRPSQLKPGNNPFLKVNEATEDTTEATKEKEETSNEDRLTETKPEPEAPKFVPLGSANVTPRTNTAVPPAVQPAPSSSGFVFGQNLSERVELKENINNGEASTTDHSSSNGATELLFTSAAASVKENQEDSNQGEPSSGDGLAAAAAEYERSHARPPPPTAHFTITGEEGEINVMQISCRLFAWEAGSWRERGRGVLRLNDAPAGSGGAARLVARVAGSLRVVLNTKLWPDMVVERAGTKSLRITAVDAQQQIKLFLIMGAPGDIVQLYRALTARVSMSKRSTSSNTGSQNATSQKAAERLEAAADEEDYLGKPEDDEQDDAADDIALDDDDDNEPANNERLEADHDEQKTEEHESNVDGMKPDKESKSLKRKEPAEDETSPKRQCPEILIE